MNTKFITFEGKDRVGKSTHIRKAVEKLSNIGYKVLSYSFPSNQVRHEVSKLENSIDNLDKILDLYIEDQELMKDIVESGKYDVIICDRYDLSTIAYHVARIEKAGLSDLSREELIKAISKKQDKLIKPHATFIFDSSNINTSNIFNDYLDKDTKLQDTVGEVLKLIQYTFDDRVFKYIDTTKEQSIAENRVMFNLGIVMGSEEPRNTFKYR